MKKILKYTKIALASVSIMVLTACGDGILNKSPLTEISDDAVWTDPALVKAFVNSRYNQIGHGWTESFQSSVVDETHLIWSRGCEPYTQGYLNPSDLGRMNGAWWGWDNRAWGTVWLNISNCNLFFQRIDEVPFSDEDEKNQLIGEVTFIRALMYHDLVSRWGAVPLITKAYTLNDIEEIMSAERSTYTQCIDFIVSECDKAISILPPRYSGSDKGRATSIAAMALKSRVLLYSASPLMNRQGVDPLVGHTSPAADRWEKAAKAAQTCIDEALSNGYALYNAYPDVKTNYTQLFLDCGNSEVLFDRQGGTTADGTNINMIDQYNGPNGYGHWGGNVPISEFVDCFEMKDGTPFSWDNPAHKAAPYTNRDERLHAYVLCDGDMWKGREVETWLKLDASGTGYDDKNSGKDTRFGQDAWNTSLSSYNMRKFMNEDYVSNSWNQQSPRNWIWFRLGEQYLNLAEALYFSGDEDGARAALKVIRDRAKMPQVTATGEELLKKIKNERRIELAFEEHRFFDVRRWMDAETELNKPATGVLIIKNADGTKTYTPGQLVENRKFNATSMYWMPIPKGETDKNPNIKQNPGYTE